MPMLTKLLEEVMGAEKDTRKFDNGNKAAGLRVRKDMQAIRSRAKLIRKEIQIVRRERKNVKEANAEELSRP